MKKIRTFQSAFDKTGTTDEALIGELARTGPPYLFASYTPVTPGLTVSIGDQVFRVVRMATRKQWFEKTKPPWFDGANPPVCYFEAVTD
jgi:hypothetical protein